MQIKKVDVVERIYRITSTNGRGIPGFIPAVPIVELERLAGSQPSHLKLVVDPGGIINHWPAPRVHGESSPSRLGLCPTCRKEIP